MDINWVREMAGVSLTESTESSSWIEETMRMLDEAVTDLPGDQNLSQMFTTASFRLEAARRALGIANKRNDAVVNI